MKQFAVQDKTHEKFMRIKGELMFKTGKNPTNDEVLDFLIDRVKKNGGV